MNKLALLFLFCLASFRGMGAAYFPQSISAPLDVTSGTLPSVCAGDVNQAYSVTVTMCPINSPLASPITMQIDWVFNGTVVYSSATVYSSTAASTLTIPAASFTYPTTTGGYPFFVRISWSSSGNPGSPCAAGAYTVTGATSNVTVLPGTQPITGSKFVCVSSTTTLADASSGGNFSSTSSNVTVTTGGVVTGVSVGTAVISYNGSGCPGVAAVVTVSTTPPAILPNPATVCQGELLFMTDSMTGGTWSVSGTASIDASTGLLFGSAVGNATVTYQVTPTCRTTRIVTVNAMPTPIAGTLLICSGTTTTLTSTPVAPSPGTWSSDNTAAATAATGASAQGIITGTAAGGTANITYTRLGCSAYAVVTVQQAPTAIVGPSAVCNAPGTITLSNTIPGGTWSSSSGTVATVSTGGVVTGVSGTVPMPVTISYSIAPCPAVTKVVTVVAAPTPGSITGTLAVCNTKNITLGHATAGGAWSSTSPFVTVGSATGIVTGNNTGTSSVTATITYSLGSNCNTTATVTVNPTPQPIGGPATVCLGFTVTATGIGGGTWSSSGGAVTINTSNGAAFGAATGTSTITYTLPTGCQTTEVMTTNPLPGAISGANTVCEGQVTTFTNAVAGTWSASNTNVAVTSATTNAMPVTGAAAGTSVVTFSLATGCYATKGITVNALPTQFTVTGGGSYCAGGSGVPIGLSNSTTGVNYQLYFGTSPSGGPVAGTGGSITFGTALAAGTYTVRATGTCTNDMLGNAVVTIDPIVTPAVSMANSTGADTMCGGLPVTFTATPSNGGSSPVYQWRVNGTPVGTSSPTYIYTPANGDIISVTLTSNAPCPTTPTAVTTHTLTVLPSDLPSVTTSVVPGTTVCAGTMVTFSAIGTNGGSAPTFRWTKNGTNVATGPTYTFLPANGDVIYVMMRSSATCNLVDSAFSPTTTMTVVTPGAAPTVSITAYPGLTIAAGTSDSLVATAFGAGSTPGYQWYVNGVAVAGATNNYYVSSTFNNHDSVTCKVTASTVCKESGVRSVIITVKNGNGNGNGVADLNTSANVSVMPNPNNGTFVIAGDWGTASEVVKIQITDLLGKVVYNASLTTDAGRISGQVSMTTMPAGVYMLSLHGDSGSKVLRIIKE